MGSVKVIIKFLGARGIPPPHFLFICYFFILSIFPITLENLGFMLVPIPKEGNRKSLNVHAVYEVGSLIQRSKPLMVLRGLRFLSKIYIYNNL